MVATRDQRMEDGELECPELELCLVTTHFCEEELSAVSTTCELTVCFRYCMFPIEPFILVNGNPVFKPTSLRYIAKFYPILKQSLTFPN